MSIADLHVICYTLYVISEFSLKMYAMVCIQEKFRGFLIIPSCIAMYLLNPHLFGDMFIMSNQVSNLQSFHRFQLEIHLKKYIKYKFNLYIKCIKEVSFEESLLVLLLLLFCCCSCLFCFVFNIYKCNACKRGG